MALEARKGRQANIRLKDFEGLAKRWGMQREEVLRGVDRMVTTSHLEGVLADSPLPTELEDKYRAIVAENVRTLGGG